MKYLFSVAILAITAVTGMVFSQCQTAQTLKLKTLQKEVETIYLKEDFSQKQVKFIVEKIGFKKEIGDEDYPIKADGVFLLVKISIVNKSWTTKVLDAPGIYIEDAAQNHYLRSSKGESLTSTPLSFKECQPNLKTTAVMVFDVPKKSDDYKLVFEGMSDYPATVELKYRPESSK